MSPLLCLSRAHHQTMFKLPTSAVEFQDCIHTLISRCNGRCIHRGTHRYPCWPCRRIQQHICKCYHNTSPVFELIGRLIFESVIGVIPVECVVNGTWLLVWNRDPGHHMRIKTLSRIVKQHKTPKSYSWLQY